jgi:hypothetical protein
MEQINDNSNQQKPNENENENENTKNYFPITTERQILFQLNSPHLPDVIIDM